MRNFDIIWHCEVINDFTTVRAKHCSYVILISDLVLLVRNKFSLSNLEVQCKEKASHINQIIFQSFCACTFGRFGSKYSLIQMEGGLLTDNLILKHIEYVYSRPK